MSEEDAVAELLAAAAAERDGEPINQPASLALLDDDDDDEETTWVTIYPHQNAYAAGYAAYDETLAERLWGLTEMFPEPIRNVTGALASLSIYATKSLYSVGRNGMWVAASSAIILALPVLFEMERSQMEEQQLQQQRQILLGPNAATSGSGMMPSMPQLVPPQVGQR